MSIVRRRPVLWGQPAADHHMHEPYLYDAQYHRPHYDPDTPGRTPMSGFSNTHVHGLLNVATLIRLAVCCALTNAYVVIGTCVTVGMQSNGYATNHSLPFGAVVAVLTVHLLYLRDYDVYVARMG